MARIYEWGTNPFQDFLFASLLYGADISTKKAKKEIFNTMCSMLEQILSDDDDLMYLSFDIKKKNVYFRVVCNNIISALWLSGIFPKDTKYVMDRNEFIMNDIKYKFNKKTKKLTYHKIR